MSNTSSEAQQQGYGMRVIGMTASGKATIAEVEDRTLVVYFLREHLRPTGTHIGRDTSQCGACTTEVRSAP
jgi:aerobic carbon-monoxide dehydrogenase small subunit